MAKNKKSVALGRSAGGCRSTTSTSGMFANSINNALGAQIGPFREHTLRWRRIVSDVADLSRDRADEHPNRARIVPPHEPAADLLVSEAQQPPIPT
jgi:hypothetical protein